MLSTSFAFRRYVSEGGHLANKVVLTFADGTTRTLYGDDLMMGGVSFSTASSSVSSFDIGAAIIGTASVTLANFDERWNAYDFTGATGVISVGATLDDDTTEWLLKGTYGVEQPELYDSTISLECYDNMRLFQVPYSDVGTIYPATLQAIATDICQACGVTMLAASFPHDSQVVSVRPDDDNLSCIDVLSWVAQMAGCFCDVDPWGRLRIRWYDLSAFETEDWLDGGTFDTDTTPYSDGDVANGGYFHYGGDVKDGGSFQQPQWAVVSAIKSLTTATDDVVITGVKVTASDQVRSDGTQGAKGESYTYGTEGYVLSIEGNKLVTYGSAQSVARAIGPSIVGMRFRPLTVTAIGDPAIEAGDPMLVVDWRQRTFRSWVTSTTWKQGSYQSMGCGAKTPTRLSAEGYDAVTRAIVQQRNVALAERNAREIAVAQLARELSEASGLFKTEQEQQDQSVIYYLHDKPTLAESQIIWKMTSAAFGVSVDGGRTYPFGFDAWGNAILNAIYAIGINASYINTGSLNANLITTGKIQSRNGKVYFDLTHNELHCDKLVSTDSGTVGNFTASIKSNQFYNTTRYGLALDNSNYADGTMIISPGSSDSHNMNYRPSIMAKDGVYIVGGTNSLKPRSLLEVDATYGIFLSVTGGYSNNIYGSQITLEMPTSDSEPEYDMAFQTRNNFRWGFMSSGAKFDWNGYGCTINWLRVSGTKNRVVGTEDYGNRLLYCYETSAPMFGDVGSGVIGEDGICVVAIDDVFAECSRMDMAYQVFLQKCGPGDLWVSEKKPAYFVVEGTPNLAFDWEAKARQKDYENDRLETMEQFDELNVMGQEDLSPLNEYDDETSYIQQIESLYEEA